MLEKYLNAFFENAKYVKGGITEIYTPVEQFIFNVMHSPIFKVLYFIPFAILKLITIIVSWYYENFMNNELMLQSSANRVIFVYLIPAAVIFVLLNLLSANEGLGFRILFASPFIFIFFPLFVIWGIGTLLSKIGSCHEDDIINKKERLLAYPPKEVMEIRDDGLRRGKLGEMILEYALKKVSGYKKVLTNLYVPINDKGDEFTEVDAVVINKNGIFVWEAKYPRFNCIYGKRNADVWYKYAESSHKVLVEREIETGVGDYRVQKFMNPLKQNRMHVNAIQKQLRLNGFKNAHMFSGVAFTNIYECYSSIECGPDEAACNVSRVPQIMKIWSRMSKEEMSKEEVDKIANFLSQYVDHTPEAKQAHIKRLKDKYGVQSEDELDVNKLIARAVSFRKETV